MLPPPSGTARSEVTRPAGSLASRTSDTTIGGIFDVGVEGMGLDGDSDPARAVPDSAAASASAAMPALVRPPPMGRKRGFPVDMDASLGYPERPSDTPHGGACQEEPPGSAAPGPQTAHVTGRTVTGTARDGLARPSWMTMSGEVLP